MKRISEIIIEILLVVFVGIIFLLFGSLVYLAIVFISGFIFGPELIRNSGITGYIIVGVITLLIIGFPIYSEIKAVHNALVGHNGVDRTLERLRVKGVVLKYQRELVKKFIRGVVKKKILKGLGLDQVVSAGSGSAPLPAELIIWYRKLGLNLFEGYAMTEDFAWSHSCTNEINEPGSVGIPGAGVQARISPEGEILIKSPGQMVGYYKRPDLDAEAFTEDGYFKTGDQGQQRADGLLKITGRLKEIFKTSKGKYVAPAPIENKLNVHPMVEMSIVSGVAQSAAYAMVVLAEDIRPKTKDPEVRAKVAPATGLAKIPELYTPPITTAVFFFLHSLNNCTCAD